MWNYFFLDLGMKKTKTLKVCRNLIDKIDGVMSSNLFLLQESVPNTIKDVRGWQFLTMKAAETLCIVFLSPEKHIS